MKHMDAVALGLALPSAPEATPEPETVQESTFNTSEVETLARESLDFLAALAMPVVFRYLFPPVFKSIWTWLLSYVS